jgi:hypothetical protein
MLRLATSVTQVRTIQAALEIAFRETLKPQQKAAFAVELERLNSLVPPEKPKKR